MLFMYRRTERTALREEIAAYIAKKYNVYPDFPFVRYPDYTVYRHKDNEKMFAFLTAVSGDRLGVPKEKEVDLLNLKLKDPLLVDLLVQQPGFSRGYYMKRGNWLSIRLDGTVPLEEVCHLLDESYLATASSATRKKLRAPKEWIVPANPKYYDIEAAFDRAEEIDWKQGIGIKKGDTAFMYVAARVSAILYQCLVTETDIPFYLEKGDVHVRRVMRIRLLRRYPRDRFTFDVLGKEYGIFAVRGPRGIPQKLSEALK